MIQIELIKQHIKDLDSKLIRGASASQVVMETNCKSEAYKEILDFIVSLQQEQPEVDLEKEITKVMQEGALSWGISYSDMCAIAEHFYELGLNARKEE